MCRQKRQQLLGAHAEGPQNPASQNGMLQSMIGKAASATSACRPRWTKAAAPTALPKPSDTHASVRRLIFPTIFSSYSPMSFCTGILSAIRDAPYAGSQDVSS